MATQELPRLNFSERIDWFLGQRDFSWKLHRFVYRLSGGRLMASKRGIPVMLLSTTGAVSGKTRTVPVMYMPDGERAILVASNGGKDTDPAWWRNLRANGLCDVQAGRKNRLMRARFATAGEREELWPRLVELNPFWGRYQSMTGRSIPVVVLEPATKDA